MKYVEKKDLKPYTEITTEELQQLSGGSERGITGGIVTVSLLFCPTSNCASITKPCNT